MSGGQLYLELLKRALNNYLYLGGAEPFERYRTLAPSRYARFRWSLPEPVRPHTLLGKTKLDRLERIVVSCLRDGVAGDLIEAGVWRGGAAIFMRAVLEAHGVRDRIVWVADSFKGIPPSRSTRGDPVDAWADRWSAPLGHVKAHFRRYGLLDRQVRFVRGMFASALRRAPLGRLAVVRIDADSYESTRDALVALHPRLSPGGYVCIDDWHLPGAREAAIEYRRAHGITARIDESLDAVWRVGGLRTASSASPRTASRRPARRRTR